MEHAKHLAAEALKEVVPHSSDCPYGTDGVTNCWCHAETTIRVVLDALEDDPDENPVTDKLADMIAGLPVTKG